MTMKEDPDRYGARTSASNPNQSIEKGTGRSGKNLARLSGKKDKIMASYEAYLSEIQTESNDDDGELDPALKSMNHMRENVRFSDAFHDAGARDDVESSLPIAAKSDDGGLYRAWNYENGAPGPMSDITSVGPATVAAGMSSSYNNNSSGGILRSRKKHSRRIKYAQPWLHSRKAKGWIAMIATSIFIIVVVIVVVSITVVKNRNGESMNPTMDDTNNNGVIEPDWEAAYKAEAKKEEELLAEIDMLKNRMEKHVPPPLELKLTETDIAIVEGIMASHSGKDDEKEKEVVQEEVSAIENDKAMEQDVHQEEEDTIASPQDQYYKAVMQYTPKMFDRSHGWNGQTYEEAIMFCHAESNMSVCPYEALCPEGVGSEPLGGYRGGPHGDWNWVPVSDGWNEWVQAGAREECVMYSHKFGEEPEWGVTGKGIATEGFTQNLMCCTNVA